MLTNLNLMPVTRHNTNNCIQRRVGGHFVLALPPSVNPQSRVLSQLPSGYNFVVKPRNCPSLS